MAAAFGARYLRVEGASASRARNAGLQAATGDFIAFLDDDDRWLPEHLRPHLRLLASRPDLDAVFGQALLIDAAGHPYYLMPGTQPADGDAVAAFFTYHPQIGGTVARTSVRDTVGYFDPSLPSAEDWDWQLRLATRLSVSFISVPSVEFRQRAAGEDDAIRLIRLRGTLQAFFTNARRAGPRRAPPRLLARELFKLLGRYEWELSMGAQRAAEQGRRGDAVRALGWAALSSPPHAARDALRPSPLRSAIRTLVGQR
ncbi:MAG: glycosyltransferase [Chloroflexi bacterium]|nr:glycosyltransferase [Chloroflexota bacterium]